ncbi:MAG TPA: hypothetical protein PKE31_21640 [Pseudomonadota bacterium]|nr:hypothetical protein [Pseudomonadota bacterium]
MRKTIYDAKSLRTAATDEPTAMLYGTVFASSPPEERQIGTVPSDILKFDWCRPCDVYADIEKTFGCVISDGTHKIAYTTASEDYDSGDVVTLDTFEATLWTKPEKWREILLRGDANWLRNRYASGLHVFRETDPRIEYAELHEKHRQRKERDVKVATFRTTDQAYLETLTVKQLEKTYDDRSEHECPEGLCLLCASLSAKRCADLLKQRRAEAAREKELQRFKELRELIRPGMVFFQAEVREFGFSAAELWIEVERVSDVLLGDADDATAYCHFSDADSANRRQAITDIQGRGTYERLNKRDPCGFITLSTLEAIMQGRLGKGKLATDPPPRAVRQAMLKHGISPTKTEYSAGIWRGRVGFYGEEKCFDSDGKLLRGKCALRPTAP